MKKLPVFKMKGENIGSKLVRFVTQKLDSCLYHGLLIEIISEKH